MAAIAAVALVVLTRDPTEPLAVAAVIAGSAIAAACTVALLGIAVEGPRPRRRRPRQGVALRRGLEIGAVVAALGLLRAADGLTLITGGFVVAGFVLAEVVMSARPAARSG